MKGSKKYILCLAGMILFAEGWLWAAWGNPDSWVNQAYIATKSRFNLSIYGPTENKPISLYKAYNPPKNPSGLLYHDRKKSYPTPILYADTNFHAHLMDLGGNVLHSWHLEPKELKRHCKSCTNPAYFRAVALLDDGGLLAITINKKTTPWGGPLIKINKNSKIEWVFDAHCHHTFTETPDGSFYVLAHRFAKHPYNPKDPLNKLSHYYHHQLPYLDDQVVHLDGTGKVLDTFSILDTIGHSRFANLSTTLSLQGRLHHDQRTDYDPLHSNAIQYITAKLAKTQPWLEEGDLLIHLRHISSLLLIQNKTKELKQLITGPWFYGHDAQILSNGHLLMFDNLSQWPSSRILEYDFNKEQTIWSFSHDATQPKVTPLASEERGAVQRLPNGNTMICDYNQNRMLEVTPDKKIVWLYKTKTSKPQNAKHILNTKRLRFLEKSHG